VRDSLIEELRVLLAEVVGKEVADIQPEDDLVESLGIDSLTGLRFLAVIEKKYALRFPDHHLAEIRTLAKVRDYIIAGREGGGT
jgi:acyl carrier protein